MGTLGIARALGGSMLLIACSSEPEPLTERPRSSPRVGRLTILHSSDLHSHVFPFRKRLTRFDASDGLGTADSIVEVGGFSRIAAEIARVRALGDPVVYLDSGDALEGTALFERYRGEPEFRALGAMGLAAMGLGNHELSLGSAGLATLIAEQARFPILATNLLPAPDSPLENSCSHSVTLDVAGLRLGLVAAVNESSPPGLDQAANAFGARVVEVARSLQPELDRVALHADLLVVLSHLGLEADRELVARTSGIDLVLGGHQHITTPEPVWVDDCQSQAHAVVPYPCSPQAVAIVHSGAYGTRLSQLELELESSEEGNSRRRMAGLALSALPITANLPEHPEVRRLLEPYRDAATTRALAFVPQRLGRRSALGADTELGNFVADRLREASAADVAVFNTSALRSDLEAGATGRDDFSRALPFADEVQVAFVGGAALTAAFTRAAMKSAQRGCEAQVQISGLRWAVNCGSCRTQRSNCSALFRGDSDHPITDEDQLRLAVPSYLTQPSALFAGTTSAPPTVLDVRFSELIWADAGKLAPLPPDRVPRCVTSLSRLDLAPCERSFGASSCPLSRETAQTFCETAPAWLSQRDARITMSMND